MAKKTNNLIPNSIKALGVFIVACMITFCILVAIEVVLIPPGAGLGRIPLFVASAVGLLMGYYTLPKFIKK